MTVMPGETFSEILGKYAPHLLDALAERLNRSSRGKKGDPIERIEKAFETPKTLEKLVADLEQFERNALAVFLNCPGVFWRWDHAVRLLTACGIPSAYRALQSLLASGLVCLKSNAPDGMVQRFELPDDLVLRLAPSVGLSPPVAAASLKLPIPIEPAKGLEGDRWRAVDGWDIPIRIALLWQLAHRVPIRKTQQNQLFKRDQERILLNPQIASGLLDAVEPVEDLGGLVYGLAVEQGLLRGSGEEESPVAALHEYWPATLADSLLVCGRALLSVETWNELGPLTPVGTFARETPTARYIAMLLLATLPEGFGVTPEYLGERIAMMHPPWNASGDLIGSMRHAEARSESAATWTRATLLGPMYQLGLTEVGVAKSKSKETLVRLSALGRQLLVPAVELPAAIEYPQTLFAQPNHSIVVYRQGLSIELLSRLVQFAEARSVGAALTFELTADSVYRGLESGLSAEDMTEILVRHGSRELPAGVAASIRTWAQKRERLAVYVSSSLLEFADPKDVDRAIEGGLEGVRINDRILLLTGEQDRNLSLLRLTSTRDYRLAPEPCVAAEDDGVTLAIDSDKSDLLLDAELQRFAVATPSSNGVVRNKTVRVTPQSMRAAVEQGMTMELLEDWFMRRTGEPPPASVRLLMHASNGLDLRSNREWVVRTSLPEIADGLLQHPQTRGFIRERLGPMSMTVADAELPALKAAVAELGLTLDIESSV